MDWRDYLFPARKVLQKAAQGPVQSQQQEGNAGIDIAKMAQDQANNERAKQFIGAPQPTMEQLKGTGQQQNKSCPTCGAPVK